MSGRCRAERISQPSDRVRWGRRRRRAHSVVGRSAVTRSQLAVSGAPHRPSRSTSPSAVLYRSQAACNRSSVSRRAGPGRAPSPPAGVVSGHTAVALLSAEPAPRPRQSPVRPCTTRRAGTGGRVPGRCQDTGRIKPHARRRRRRRRRSARIV